MPNVTISFEYCVDKPPKFSGVQVNGAIVPGGSVDVPYPPNSVIVALIVGDKDSCALVSKNGVLVKRLKVGTSGIARTFIPVP